MYVIKKQVLKVVRAHIYDLFFHISLNKISLKSEITCLVHSISFITLHDEAWHMSLPHWQSLYS